MKFIKLDIDECYAYLVANKANETVIIDPKLDYAEYYLNLLNEKGLKLTLIIDTHSHADHLSAGAYLREKTGATYGMYETNNSNAVNRFFKDGEEFNIGELNFKIIHTPGHTSNSMSIICEDKFFTGDFLFLDGSGRDDLPTGEYEAHFNSIKKIQDLPDYLIVCPGHNYGSNNLATLYQVRKENPVLSCGTLEKFKEITKPDAEPEAWMANIVALNNKGNTSLDAFKIPSTKSVCQKGAAENKPLDNITYITKEELDKMLNSNYKPILLDVRQPKEFLELKPIEGIINIPIEELPKRIGELEKYRGKTFISICKSGGRAMKGAKMIHNLDLGKIFVLKGGMQEYRE
ncbi:MAG: MBL fold metallo-hydrolase [Sarcina sp.]